MIVIKVIYTVQQKQYKITVVQTYDYMYHIVYQHLDKINNRTILSTIANKRFAIEAAKRFPETYMIAKQKGFTFVGDKFIHLKNRITILVEHAIEFTPDRFMLYLWDILN